MDGNQDLIDRASAAQQASARIRAAKQESPARAAQRVERRIEREHHLAVQRDGSYPVAR